MGGRWHAVYYLHIHYPSGQEQSELASEWISCGALLSALGTLFWNDFPCNLACVATAEKGPDEYLLFNDHTPLIWLFLLVWL